MDTRSISLVGISDTASTPSPFDSEGDLMRRLHGPNECIGYHSETGRIMILPFKTELDCL